MAALLSLATASPIKNSTVVPLINGINLGTLILNGDSVAWFSGHPKSDYTVIGPNNVNPCTRTFDLKVNAGGTTGTYQEFGCGGPSTDFWIDKNGVFYAQCTPFSEPDADGVHTTWHCS
ncbi:hypothetical protein C8J57DRAFT_1257261 [Mycena rebaudengoi]|nr:hypothetical protein C8J57DRAFT_1257261 [Mycena rebaudengoi]